MKLVVIFIYFFFPGPVGSVMAHYCAYTGKSIGPSRCIRIHCPERDVSVETIITIGVAGFDDFFSSIVILNVETVFYRINIKIPCELPRRSRDIRVARISQINESNKIQRTLIIKRIRGFIIY